LLLIAVFNKICHVSPDYKPYVVRLHEILTSFTSRSQTIVELFVPLSTIVGSSPDGRVWLTAASHIVWTLVGAAFFRMLQAHKIVLVSNLLTRTALYALLAGIAWFSTSVRQKDLLSLVPRFAITSLLISALTT
jgi:membrane associated rhomboid family serine protease